MAHSSTMEKLGSPAPDFNLKNWNQLIQLPFPTCSMKPRKSPKPTVRHAPRISSFMMKIENWSIAANTIPAAQKTPILWLEKIWGKPSMPWSRATRFLKIRFQAWVATSSGNQEWSRIISRDRSFFAGFFLWKSVLPPGLSFIFPQDLLLPKSQKFIWNQPIF